MSVDPLRTQSDVGLDTVPVYGTMYGTVNTVRTRIVLASRRVKYSRIPYGKIFGSRIRLNRVWSSAPVCLRSNTSHFRIVSPRSRPSPKQIGPKLRPYFRLRYGYGSQGTCTVFDNFHPQYGSTLTTPNCYTDSGLRFRAGCC